ncbi:hypothetical protein HNP24_000025 [Chryseobacterium sediminis]|uniref:Uncharacterized protein n=1 Tax=Chryseobacterium sediminis TaxID=1679494 RepID=A0ABR6PTP7_9FLAO|nr:hypothetical protein [Chryseobacterium sediminis]MBB6329075.1 hypothetical protein [Chryseobacterium sediminis]
MYDIFLKDIETIFNLNKLKNDLLEYLDGDNEVLSSHEINGNIKANVLEENDVLTLGSVEIIKKYEGQNFLPYKINLIIGNYKGSLGVVLVEKFIAEMFYDFNYELITIDFIHNIDVKN